MTYVIGIDVGGTFTDGVAIDQETGQEAIGKSPTTYPDPFGGVLAVLDELADVHGTTPEALLGATIKFVHGTTLTSNVVFERSGAPLALMTTDGFGDTLLMMSGKGRVAGLSLLERRHFRATDKPSPLVPRRRVIEVAERIDADGDVVVELTDAAVDDAVDRLAAMEVEACAIALLWSFRNPSHERRLRDAIARRLPHVHVTISSDLAPLLGEYERSATAAVNAYVAPAVKRYLETVDDALRSRGLRAPLLILQSSGGVAAAQETEPVQTIESGPAAGVRGSVRLLEQLGEDHAIVTDVGGTTFKVTLVEDRRPALTTETVLGQYSLAVPMIDIVSIGAGGGSIAWEDGGRLRVGPRSAGSTPGPVAYARGGTEPTVTDADLVLGYLDPEFFLGGRMQLDVEAAREAIRTRIADPLFGGDVLRAAAGIREVIDTQMADLIRKASVERGHDPREFVVLAFGGAGPVHCGAYGAELGVRRLVVPRSATVYSALGAAVSDLQHSFQLSRQVPAPGDPELIRADFGELETRARDVLAREGVDAPAVKLVRWAGMRYRRQFHELRIPVMPGDLNGKGRDDLIARFEREYANRYGDAAGHGADRVEYVRFGVDAYGATHEPALAAVAEAADAPATPIGHRGVWWRETREVMQSAVYRGTELAAGAVLEGPALIEHPGTTIAVHPGQRGTVDRFGNTIIESMEERHDGGRPGHL